MSKMTEQKRIPFIEHLGVSLLLLSVDMMATGVTIIWLPTDIRQGLVAYGITLLFVVGAVAYLGGRRS